MQSDEGSFWDHLEAFRSVIIRSLLIISLGVLLSFFFYDSIFNLLEIPWKKIESQIVEDSQIHHSIVKRERFQNSGNKPLVYTFEEVKGATYFPSLGVSQLSKQSYLIPEGEYVDKEVLEKGQELYLFTPTEGITTAMKISFWAGVVGTCPFWMFCLLRFLIPGLRKKERQLLFPFLLLSLLFIFGGFLMAYYAVIPIASDFLYNFNDKIGKNFWALGSFLDFALLLLLANGIAFEVCVVLLFLVHFGLISTESMIRKRRISYLFSFIIGAILTPPDVLTQCLMAFVLIFFYEIALFYSRFRRRKKEA